MGAVVLSVLSFQSTVARLIDSGGCMKIEDEG
jgi:hypothetical protein